jgi:hypothetical protein
MPSFRHTQQYKWIAGIHGYMGAYQTDLKAIGRKMILHFPH